jgi:hypothetical protein
MDRWEAEYGDPLVAEEVDNDCNHAIYCPPDWYLPENEISSLYLSFLKIKYPQDNPAEHLAEYKALIIAFMKSNPDLSDIAHDEYFKELDGDGMPADEMVMFAVSQSENWNIVVIDDMAKTSFKFQVGSELPEVSFVRFGKYEGVKLAYDKLVVRGTCRGLVFE